MADTANFTDASLTSYQFYVFPDETDFNDVSAVYIFLRQTIFGGW